MRTDDREVWVLLATRIPKTLHRTLKLRCVKSDTSVMAFVVGAVQEKLTRESGPRAGARRAKRVLMFAAKP